MQVTVRDLMTPRPVTISQHATIDEAIQIVLERAVDEVYVVDENDRLVGTVSDYVLLKTSIVRSDLTQPVTRVMSRSMLVLRPEAPLQEVACLFRESRYPRLCVIEDGRIIGQLGRREVLRTFIMLDELNASRDRHRRVEDAEAAVPPRPAGMREINVRATLDETACSGL
ncbi:MAG: CBS domain-containing protein [Planctomycetota bacterium]|jgi:acetoin utilization protein AcuB